MAHGGHIGHENYEFVVIEGPEPMSAFSHSLDLCHGDLGSIVLGGQTLGTTLRGCILESIHIEGPAPSLIIISEQAHGIAHSGHIQELFAMGRSPPSRAGDHDQIL
jgi:hypothetical protein